MQFQGIPDALQLPPAPSVNASRARRYKIPITAPLDTSTDGTRGMRVRFSLNPQARNR